MTSLRLFIAAWLAGLLAYAGALALLHGERISAGDLRAVISTSFVAFALCYWLLYLPILHGVRRLVPHRAWWWLLPIAAMLLGIVPTALIAQVKGGSLRAIRTPEALLFHVAFAVAGLVIGAGLARLKRNDRLATPRT